LLEIALGELNLNPDEFYEYSFEDFLIKIEGIRSSKLEEWQRTRALAFVIAKPYLKNKNMSIEQFWPLPGDKVSSTKAKGKSIRSMTPEELAEWKVQMREHMAKMANPQNN
jgi:hypothetical protein